MVTRYTQGQARSSLEEESLIRYPIPLMLCRNNDGTVIDATGGDTKFSIGIMGWGGSTLVLKGEQSQNETELTTLVSEFRVPAEYIASANVKLIVHALYDDSGGGTTPTCTIDAEVYELLDSGSAAGPDLCASAAVALTTSFADKSFTITDAGLTAGDKLLILVQTSVQEAGNSGWLQSIIGSMELQLDIKG